MNLGAFSVSLTVKDIKASKEFYEKIGFSVFAGDVEKFYLIMKNGHTLIGLFQGMFDKNILTFNPGWDDNAHKLEKFNDVREIQKTWQDAGITILNPVAENTSGPGSFSVIDPDGNPILIDQHV